MIASFRRALFISLAGLSLVALAACQSAENRADRHFQNAQELIEAEDFERAIIEFRNVFENNPAHVEARIALADLYAQIGDLGRAYQNYLLYVEQRPDELEPRLELAELAIASNNWDELGRHGAKAQELAPDAPRVQAVAAVMAYQAAVEADSASDRRDAVAKVSETRASLKDGAIADTIIIDSLLRDGELRLAIEEIDRVLAEDPDQEPFQQLKLQVLGQLGDRDAVRAQLETLVGLYPENQGYAQTLIQWYTAEGDIDAAETFIRSRVGDGDGEDAIEVRTLLIAFLNQTRGAEAALDEISAAIDAGINPDLFRSLRAGINFDGGDRSGAIAELEDIVANAEENDQTLRIKVALARMLLADGNEVAARQQIEEVLAADAVQVDAIKMRASWLIDDDKTDEAIVTLRRAQDQAPSDPEIMTLMAQAHLRNGSRGLAGEMFALAVEAAGGAPGQTADYARFLLADENYQVAETALINSLRVAPGNFDVLVLLGRVYVAQQDWPRVEQVEGTLRRLETAEGENAANSLQVARLREQQGEDEAVAFLEEMAQNEETADAATVAIVRSLLSQGDVAGAEAYVDESLSKNPDDTVLLLLRAGVLIAADRAAEADAIYQDVLATDDQNEGVWRALYLSKLRQGQIEEAEGVLDDAVAAMPEAPNLLWALAGEMERDGNIDGAIEIYERLYERLSGSPIVANNLASLIATYRDSEEELERAYAVARRLRGAEVPAFQDTYGWIAYRRGQFDDALEHLEPAAAGLPSDPIVQYHYARALAATERYEEALEQFRKAIDVAGPADTRPQFDMARDEIERIEALLADQ